MKTQYGFYFDTNRCIKCKSCEIACKQWKGIKAASFKLRRVEEITEGVFPDVRRHFYSVTCRHCAKAPCIEVCPTKAIIRRPDGIVVVNQNDCIGCKTCLDACPFGIPQFDDDGIMQKCDMCLDRIENHQIPMCAASCPTQALIWGTLEDLSSLAGMKAVKKLI